MDQADMTIDEFEDLIFAHGADLATWPQRQKARAEAFLTASPAGQAAMTQARAVDAALAAARPADPALSADLMSRILADAATAAAAPLPAPDAARAHGAGILSRFRAFVSPAAACAASAALGLWLGYAGPVDFTGVAVDALGVEAGLEFAFLDGAVASPMAGLIEALEVDE